MNLLLTILFIVMYVTGIVMYLSLLTSEYPDDVKKVNKFILFSSASVWPAIMTLSIIVVSFNELKKI